MGGQLVRQAYAAFHFATARGEPFTSNERHCLTYMASVAFDSDIPPRYWAGREALAEIALSRQIPAGSEGAAERRSIFESVRQAMAGLEKRGAIERIGSAYPGRNSEIALTVENCLPVEWRDNERLPLSQSDVAPFDKETLQMGQAQQGPETQEHPETKSDTKYHLPASTNLAAVDKQKAAA